MKDTLRSTVLLLCCSLALGACEGSPAVPAAIEARIVPNRTWYHTGEVVQLDGVVTDATGEPIEMVEVSWTVEPAAAATLGAPLEDPRSASFTLGTLGRVTFTGCVAPAEDDAAPTLCDSVAIQVDDGMPSLELEAPSPGDELDDAEGIVVRGSVADRSMAHVYVNGTAAEVDAMGRFETSIEAVFGVNHLIVSATDGVTDVSEVEMDVLWAPAFTPALSPAGRPELVLDEGLALWLGQAFFDDGVPLDATASPVMTRDLADLLELVIASLDITSVVPDPVVDSPPNFTLRVLEPTIGDAHVELDLTDDGADLFIRIGRIDARTSGVLMVDTTSLPLTGTVRGSAVAFAHLTIRKENEAADLEVTLDGLTVGIESLEGSFVSPETDAVFRLAAGLLRTTLEGVLVDALRGTVESTVPMVLRDALGAVDGALADQSIPIDSAPFPPVTLQIDGGISELRTLFRRELVASLRTTIGTDVVSVHPDSRGVAQIDPDDFTPPFVNQGSLQLAIRLALLNGLLHALWSSGLLDVDATPLLPDAVAGLVSEARLVGRLPPLLRPARPGETDDLLLSVGQLELELTFMDEPVRFAVSLDAGVNLSVRDSRIAIEVAEEPVLTVWTLQAPSNPRLLSADTVRTLLLDLWPDLSASLAGGLAFDLPLPGLGDLGGLAPDLAGLSLELDMVERPRMRRGVLVLDAELTGTLP
jgi:hypothetical protein